MPNTIIGYKAVPCVQNSSIIKTSYFSWFQSILNLLIKTKLFQTDKFFIFIKNFWRKKTFEKLYLNFNE